MKTGIEEDPKICNYVFDLYFFMKLNISFCMKGHGPSYNDKWNVFIVSEEKPSGAGEFPKLKENRMDLTSSSKGYLRILVFGS